jgi:DNA repair protein RadC
MTKHKANSEDTPKYNAPPHRAHDDDVIADALEIISHRLRVTGSALSDPQLVKDYLRIRLAEREHEVFAVIHLDAQNRVIEYDELFRGTLTQTSVYPREVVKRALSHNAAAVIFAHNHPSGVPDPSTSDKLLTTHLKKALELVDIKVLDHIIVGGMNTVSFAERGLI